MALGRPSTYTEEKALEIIKIVENTGSILAACNEVGVPRSTISRWNQNNEDFAQAIAHAKQVGYDNRAELAVERARTASDAQLDRLAFDADRWYLSKIDPKRYGDKLTLGNDPESPLVPPQDTNEDPNVVAARAILFKLAKAEAALGGSEKAIRNKQAKD